MRCVTNGTTGSTHFECPLDGPAVKLGLQGASSELFITPKCAIKYSRAATFRKLKALNLLNLFFDHRL